MKEKISQELLNFICSHFMVEETEIMRDESLIDQGIIDSFGLIEIGNFISEKYGYHVIENEMNRDNFGSFDKIVFFIEKVACSEK